MEFRQIKYFLGVAEELHFSKASEKMFIAQSALSRQIQQLEDELGILLFDRDKRNVKLTPAGAFLKIEWQRLSNELQNIHRHAKQIHKGEDGEIRIGHPGSAIYSILPDLLSQMQTKYPAVTMTLTEITETELVESLLNYQTDVGFTRELSEHPDLEIQTLFSEPFALVLNEKHPLASQENLSLKMFRNEKFILPPLSVNSKYCIKLREMTRKHGFIPNVVFESNYGSTILRLVDKNLGVSILPVSYSCNAVKSLRFIPLQDTSELYLLWRRNDENPIFKNFIQIVNEVSDSYEFKL
ncbi:MAG: LysR family transcriptional regulator [Spirosomataceae bacterium]